MAQPLVAARKNLPLGKAIPAHITQGIINETILNCTDNSGARELRVIGVKTYKGVRRRKPSAGIGDIVICSVISGDEKIRKQVVKAVVVRQKMAFRRPDGIRVMFEDNAAAIINDDGTPKGTEIRGVVAKEVGARWDKIASIAKGLM
ncbi:MAG: 50S ribosomal protein L14 [Candidatus Altarchaeum sp. CG2_30_32_3053]|nr:MAG: 50S ribosomal protein L14 [Candidatus Altarchaeum sp. CG2_30_32_3053]